jgi:hypothetical protein
MTHSNNTDLDEEIAHALSLIEIKLKNSSNRRIAVDYYIDFTKAKAKLEHQIKIAEERAYKKGYIDGGVDEILRHEKASNVVVEELKREAGE